MANAFWQNAFVRPAHRLVFRKLAMAKRGGIDTRHPLLGISDLDPIPAQHCCKRS
jgi:hypothetical protein